VTTVNVRSWCVTGETGPGNKVLSHEEEIECKKTFFSLLMVRLCCKTHPIAH